MGRNPLFSTGAMTPAARKRLERQRRLVAGERNLRVGPDLMAALRLIDNYMTEYEAEQPGTPERIYAADRVIRTTRALIDDLAPILDSKAGSTVACLSVKNADDYS